ncbi:MAG: alcohol dehydrogenase catalytic domain-containing protein [Sedimentisphaeraceae bacterium JB056]
MKAMMLTGIRQMEMRQVPDPVIKKDTDVLIKMAAVGVCGSDVHYYLSGKIGSQIVKYPFTVGHEGSGIVAEIGSAVTDVKVGDRIAIEPAVSCWKCDQCKMGRHHTCRELKFLGCPGQIEGCLSEYIVMPQESCFKISDNMSLDEAAISEPLSIGVYAVKQSIPMDGAKVGILGSGPIGLCVMLPAKAKGADAIYVTDKIDTRLDIVSANGADWTGNPDKEDVAAAILEKEPGGLDAVFECCGQQEAIDQAIEVLRPGGKLMLIGIPEEDRISIQIDKARRKEICIQNVRRQCDCVADSLDMIASNLFDVSFMATHRFNFDQTKQAFDMVADYKDGVIKAMIDFD